MNVAAELERELDPDARGRLETPAGSLPLAAPGSLEEWRFVLDLARAQGWSVLPVGTGSKLTWCRPGRPDLALSSRRWHGIEAYEPADGTVSVRSGTPWAELSRAVAEGRQGVAPDVAEPEQATAGGVVAAAQPGWDRLRHGPLRDQVLGARVLLADGSTAQSGGRLVKNVTGYDLHRLWCGSHGSLAVVLDVALRLYPCPASELWLEREVSGAREAFAVAESVRARTGVRPVAVAARGDSHRWRVAVHLAGLPASVEWERDQLREALQPDSVADGDAARARKDDWRDAERDGGRWPDLWVHDLPQHAGDTLAAVEQRAGAQGRTCTVLAHPALASVAVWFDGEAPERTRLVARLAPELRRELVPRGGRVFLRAVTAGLPAEIEPLGNPAGLALMRSLRATLDPERRLTSGRLHREL